MDRLSKLKLISGRKIIRGKGQLVREGVGSESEHEEIEIEMRVPECKVLCLGSKSGYQGRAGQKLSLESLILWLVLTRMIGETLTSQRSSLA